EPSRRPVVGAREGRGAGRGEVGTTVPTGSAASGSPPERRRHHRRSQLQYRDQHQERSMMDNGLGATPEQLGVRPSAELAQRFLTHAFGWMFAGLLITAGVAAIVQ